MRKSGSKSRKSKGSGGFYRSSSGERTSPFTSHKAPLRQLRPSKLVDGNKLLSSQEHAEHKREIVKPVYNGPYEEKQRAEQQ